jgi:hypothetical protein
MLIRVLPSYLFLGDSSWALASSSRLGELEVGEGYERSALWSMLSVFYMFYWVPD